MQKRILFRIAGDNAVQERQERLTLLQKREQCTEQHRAKTEELERELQDSEL